MADNSFTIQRQPLRVPENFGRQERMLVVQIEEVLDDVYRRIARLDKQVKELGERISSLEDT